MVHDDAFSVQICGMEIDVDLAFSDLVVRAVVARLGRVVVVDGVAHRITQVADSNCLR